MQELYKEYNSENKNTQKVNELQSALDNFKQMKQQIVTNNLTDYLDKAHTLSLDYSNSHQINCRMYEASGAYGMSLRAFTELHRGDLSNHQYLSLRHAVEMLASYDQDNHLQQGLKSDSNFVNYLKVFALNDAKLKSDGSVPLINESPNYQLIRRKIDRNAHNLLHGKKDVIIGKNKAFDMKRFLPDAEMKSETNQIVLQTGGMLNHSAIARIIKVGMLKNGTRAPRGVTPDYFNYFKVENNLGAGCHEPNPTDKTCTGTFITKLQPTYSHHGSIHLSKINPAQNPAEYQSQMEHTLAELIKVERELCFYRKPKAGPNGEKSSPPNSAEAHEWLRLKARREILDGIPFSGKVDFSTNSNGEEISTWVHNQRGYRQEGGSCAIFSIKQLVTSIVGSELASLHSQFLQRNDGAQHLQFIEEQIDLLTKQIKQATKIERKQIIHQVLGSERHDREIYVALRNIVDSKRDKLSPGVISDLKTISTFCNAKLKLAERNNFDDHYKTSIKEFYRKAIDIRLSDLSHEEQAQQMKNVAHSEFAHRHGTHRLLADIITMLGTLFGMGVARVITGHSFFWSTAATARESEFTGLIHPNQQSDTLLSPIQASA